MDQAILEFIQQHFRNSFTETFFTGVTFLGNGGFIWILLSIWFLCTKTYRKQGIVLLAVLAATFLLGDVLLKNLIQRPRPFQDFPTELLITPPESYSFPSGHTSSSFAAASVLFRIRKSWGTAAFVLAALIGFSRMFLLVHYPTDVLAGAALGLLVGNIVCFFVGKKKTWAWNGKNSKV